MQKRHVLSFGLAALILCSEAFAVKPEFVTEAYVDGLSPLGNGNVVYALPETELALKVTYTVVSEILRHEGYEYGSRPSSIKILKPIEVTVSSVPDLANRYLVRAQSIDKNPFFSVLAGMTLDADGRLTGANASLDDRTLSTVSKFLTFSARAALFFAAGPTTRKQDSWDDVLTILNEKLCFPSGEESTLGNTFQNLVVSMQNTLERLVAEAAQKQPSLDTLEDLQDTLTLTNLALDAFLARYRKYRTDEYTVEILVTTEDFAPSATASDDDQLVAEVIPDETQIPGGIKSAMKELGEAALPRVAISLAYVTADWKHASNYFDIHEQTVSGVIHRYSAPVNMEISLNNRSEVLDSRTVHFPQFGRFVVSEIRRKPFTNRSTKLAVSPITGNLVSYEVSSGSTAEAVAGFLDSTSKELQGVYASNLGQQISERTLAGLSAEERPLDAINTELARYNTLLSNWSALASGLQSLSALPSP